MLLKSYFKHFLSFDDLRIAKMRAYAYRIIYFCTIVDIIKRSHPPKLKTGPRNKRNQNMIKYLIIAMGVCHETSLHVLVNTYMFFAVCLFKFVCVDT